MPIARTRKYDHDAVPKDSKEVANISDMTFDRFLNEYFNPLIAYIDKLKGLDYLTSGFRDMAIVDLKVTPSFTEITNPIKVIPRGRLVISRNGEGDLIDGKWTKEKLAFRHTGSGTISLTIILLS